MQFQGGMHSDICTKYWNDEGDAKEKCTQMSATNTGMLKLMPKKKALRYLQYGNDEDDAKEKRTQISATKVGMMKMMPRKSALRYLHQMQE